MVEMAIMMPILAVMLFAVIEFGIAFQRWQVVSNAAREGARVAAVRTNSCAGTPVETTVLNYLAGAGLGASDVVISAPAGACTASTGTPLTVTVRHDYTFPVLSGFVPGLGGGIPLTGSSVMRKE